MRLAAGNIRNWAMHAAAMEFVPELEATLSPPVQREGMLIQSRTICITSQVLISPEETNSLRPSWLTGDFNHIENRKQGLTPRVLSPPRVLSENREQGLTPKGFPFEFLFEFLHSL